MIIICCCKHINESEVNWAEWTLAIFTILLVGAAIIQMFDIKKFIKQNGNLNHLQSAENIIVKQIEFHYKILERIESNKKDIFFTIYESLRGNYGFATDNTIEERINTAYSKLYQEYGDLLGHYYRNLYRIWKNINETEIEGFDKKFYAKLVRAQLSENEILLLFYNCLWVQEYDEGNFKELIEEYELLEGINYDRLIDREHSETMYLQTAFGTDDLT